MRAERNGAPRLRLTCPFDCPFFFHVQSFPLDQGMVPRRFHSGPRLNFEFNLTSRRQSSLVPALVAGEDVVLARFGINRLGSADKPRPPLLNVRTDGMRKGQFRKHLKERRCVIPCEGFYEWRDEGGKQPYYFSRTRRRQGRRVA